jgi:hypothetical protein
MLGSSRASGISIPIMCTPGDGANAVFDRFDQKVAAGLAVRHDHGSQYVAHDFQKELAFLGIESSPAFVRARRGTAAPSASSAP